jgi:hypothetical protein
LAAEGASGGFDIATLYFDLWIVDGWIEQKRKIRSCRHKFMESFRSLGSKGDGKAGHARDIARAKAAAGKHCGRPPLAPELAERIRQAMAVPGRPGIRVIAKQFGVSPITVQNVAN